MGGIVTLYFLHALEGASGDSTDVLTPCIAEVHSAPTEGLIKALVTCAEKRTNVFSREAQLTALAAGLIRPELRDSTIRLLKGLEQESGGHTLAREYFKYILLHRGMDSAAAETEATLLFGPEKPWVRSVAMLQDPDSYYNRGLERGTGRTLLSPSKRPTAKPSI